MKKGRRVALLAASALYLYSPSRGVRGALYDMVREVSKKEYQKLCTLGPDNYLRKYDPEDD
jgi:hypothetical protein